MNSAKEPRFFYGYVIVAAAFVVMILSFGTNYSFGVFLESLLDEFGWTRAATSGAYSLCLLVSGFLGVFAGRMTDKFGPRVVNIAIGLFLGSGFMLLSQVSALWQFYLLYSLMVAAGLGSTFPSLVSTVSRWFVRQRGWMTGIVLSGIGVGTLTISPLASWLISIYDWRVAYIIIGLITLVLISLAALFLKGDPHQIRQLPYGEYEHSVKQEVSISEARGFSFQEVIRNRQFWTVCIIYLLFGFVLNTIMVHIVIHATGVGISATPAAGILATIGGISIVGKIAGGVAGDRFGVKPALVFAFVLMLVDLIWLITIREIWMFYLFGVVFGFTYGNIIALQPLLTAELFGLSSLGVILGSISCIFTFGGAAGPFIAGYIFDVNGSYQPAFLSCVALSIASIILVSLLRPNHR